jgi:hypothetical protein
VGDASSTLYQLIVKTPSREHRPYRVVRHRVPYVRGMPTPLPHNSPVRVEPSTCRQFLTGNERISSRDEYRHLLCYGVFTAATNSALETAMETIRAVTSTPDEQPTPTHSSTRRYVHIKLLTQRGKRDSPTLGASRRIRSSPAKNASRSDSSSRVASIPSPPTVEATSSTDSCQPWRTNDSKSTSHQLQKRKQLHSSTPTSLD